MNRLPALAIVSALLAAASVPLVAAPPEGKRWAEGRILVQPRAGLAGAELEKILQRAGGRGQGRLRKLEVHVVRVAPQAEEAVAAALRRNPHIEFAEPDELISPEESSPNDPHYVDAWHLTKIRAPSAWDLSKGDDVVVAILDTGVDPFHPDLSGKLVSGWNAVSNNADTRDIYGHGTRVAGTAAAASDNGIGVASVAWSSQIMPVRISNDSTRGYAYASHIASGITWAVDHGAKVANVSYNVNGSSTVKNAAQYMKNRGGLVVTAAGNSGHDPGFRQSSSLIAVSATASSDATTSWSNHGAYIDVAAPGSGIWTTSKGGSYGAASGTSFASPVTAGLIALVVAANRALSPDEVTAVITSTAEDLGASGWDPHYGAGRIDAGAAVLLASDGSSQDTDPPEAQIVSPAPNAQVSGLVAVDVTASDNVGVSRVELIAGGRFVGADTTQPYRFSWDSARVDDGIADLVAYAYDAAGNSGISGTVTVRVANDGEDSEAPVVEVTRPADGASVKGSVTVSARATDNVAVAIVRLYVDGRQICAGGSIVSCSWNSRKAGAGGHDISAVAQDTSGNESAHSISVTACRGKSCGKGGKRNEK